jgi:hypothetical protein
MIGDFKLGDPEPDAMTFVAASAPAGPATSASAGTATSASAGPATGAERDHAAQVAAHEAATGWGPESAVRLASLTSRIAKLQRQSPIGAGQATVAVLVGLADLALAGLAIVCTFTGNGELASTGVLILLAMFVPTVWAAWTLTRLVQGRREHVYRAELDRLRRDRGCGDPDCPRCD